MRRIFKKKLKTQNIAISLFEFTSLFSMKEIMIENTRFSYLFAVETTIKWSKTIFQYYMYLFKLIFALPIMVPFV